MKLSIQQIHKQFPSFEPDLVGDFQSVAEVKRCKKGEFIIQQGQYFKSSLILLDGVAKVLRSNSNGGFFMHFVKGGDALSLSLMYGNRQQVSEVSLMAVEDTTYAVFPLSCMDKWMVQYPGWYNYILDLLRQRIGDLLRTIDNLVFMNLNERLIIYLKTYSSALRSKNIPLTRTEIAREFNSSREVITRLLKQLALKGRVIMHRHYIELVDL